MLKKFQCKSKISKRQAAASLPVTGLHKCHTLPLNAQTAIEFMLLNKK